MGCSASILAAFLPRIENAVGISLTTLGSEEMLVLLIGLAVLSGGIAAVVLLRRPATGAVAVIVVALAIAQLCVSIWNAVNVVNQLEQVGSALIFGRLIGTGVYGCILGSAVTLAGGVIAWTRRASPGDRPFGSGV